MKIIVFRTVLIYLSVWFAMRLMGKRQLGELQPSELVSTILISNLASISIESVDIPLLSSLIPLYLITGMEILNSVISLKFRRYAEFVQGRPKTVIRDGMIDQKALEDLRISVSDLLGALRSKDVFDPREVSCAIIETDGALSVAKCPANETVTRDDLALTAPAQNAFVPFVLEGEVLKQNLHWCKKDMHWVEDQLASRGLVLCEVQALLGNETEDCYLIQANINKGKNR